MKQYSNTVGFLPKVVLKEHLAREWVLGARNAQDQLVGYLLFARYPNRFRITQLCVSINYRNQGIARKLLEALKATATTQKIIKLSCRNDYPAHLMWPKLGFVPLEEKVGRSKEGHLLTIWRLNLALDDQQALFRADMSEDTIDAAIDAQIFFDFSESSSLKSQPSKTLLADFLVDSIRLWYSDELLVEISRNPNQEERQSARIRAGQFFQLRYDPILFETSRESLLKILPSRSLSQVSDINHLAKTAASDVRIFVTRDRALLKKAQQIHNAVDLTVLSPTELILRQRELAETEPYVPDRVSGLGLEWRRFSSTDFEGFPLADFLVRGERLNKLRAMLEAFLVDPKCEVEVLSSNSKPVSSNSKPVALRVISYDNGGALTLSLGRLGVSEHRDLLGRFLISDVTYKAMRNGLEVVKFEASALPLNLVRGLSEMGFVQCQSGFVRFCITRFQSYRDLFSVINEICPEGSKKYRDMSTIELERHCSPLITDTDQSYFLIPIRKGYALNLFDRQQSAIDLFGGNPEVLLRWSNVYYRAANFHKMLKPPGRIMWYASKGSRMIVAVSHLDEVVIDTPKKLLQRYAKLGTLEWNDLFKMCKGDVSTKLMALKFSHTFPLRKPVSLKEIWNVFDQDGIGRSIRAPKKIPYMTFRKLFAMGFPWP